MNYSCTFTPILRAVPAMIFMAAFTSWAFKSGIFFSAISLSCAFVSVPTFTLFGSAEPFPGSELLK